MLMTTEALKDIIRDIPDFPKPGIVFKDITPLMKDPGAFRFAVDQMAEPFRGRVDVVVGIESRGFIFGAAIAQALGVGFVPVRKPGKLPHETQRCEYQLEYGSDALEIHCDALEVGSRALVVDDVIATGGTAVAAVELCRRLGADVIGASFLIELDFLKGRDKLPGLEIVSVLNY